VHRQLGRARAPPDRDERPRAETGCEDFGFPVRRLRRRHREHPKRTAFQALYAEAASELLAIRGYLGDSGSGDAV
jgi:hypothetical protein